MSVLIARLVSLVNNVLLIRMILLNKQFLLFLNLPSKLFSFKHFYTLYLPCLSFFRLLVSKSIIPLFCAVLRDIYKGVQKTTKLSSLDLTLSTQLSVFDYQILGLLACHDAPTLFQFGMRDSHEGLTLECEEKFGDLSLCYKPLTTR